MSSNVTLNSTFLPHTTTCLPTPTYTSLIFQLSHLFLLLAYLTPGGPLSLLLTHAILALGHLTLGLWLWTTACIRLQLPSLLGWTALYLTVNLLRAGYQLYGCTLKVRVAAELKTVYQQLFEPIRVSQSDFQKLVSRGRLMDLQIGEAYAMEGLTPTDRLSLLVSGKINVMSGGQFLHTISPREFLDSPEWESSSTATSSSLSQNGFILGGGGGLFKRGRTKGSKGHRDSLTETTFTNVNSASRYAQFDGTTGKTGKARGQEVQSRFNISLIAAAPSQYLFWDRASLEYFLVKDGFMANVMSLLLARDITNKLYQMNEKLSNEKCSQIDIRLPVIINSFTKRLDTPLSTLNRPRSLFPRRVSTEMQHKKAVAISTLATMSTSRSVECSVADKEKEEGRQMSPGTFSSHPSRSQSHSSSSELYIEMKSPGSEDQTATVHPETDEEDSEELSSSSSGSNWNGTVHSLGSLRKQFYNSKGDGASAHEQTEGGGDQSGAVNVPLIPKNGK